MGAEAILMSTHNLGFYEDLTKIIFELSSNIIKYELISSAALSRIPSLCRYKALGMGKIILLWHSLSLPYTLLFGNYSALLSPAFSKKSGGT